MILPTNGRVVVVDDEPNEGLALVKALSKNNISAKYFSGVDYEEMPEKPLNDIRVVFLDMILGTDGSSLKTKASKAIGVLRRIVDTSRNVPYILVAWTKDPRLITHVIEGLNDKNSAPIMCVDLEKSACKDTEGNYEITDIETKLIEKCNDFKSLTAFLVWENLVDNCAGQIFDDFTTFYPIETQWDTKLKGVICGLAEAVVGREKMQGETMTSTEKLRNAMLGINSVLVDTLENTIQNKDDLGDVGTINSVRIDSKVKSSINTKLHLLKHAEVVPQAGDLYILRRPRRTIIDEIVTTNAEPNKRNEILESRPKLIELDITPRCDYAQSKRYSRLLTGIALDGQFKSNKYIKTSKELSYSKCPVVTINGKEFYLLFDYRFFKSLTLDKLKIRKTKSKYRIRHELVVDIQAGFSNHINRFGVTCID